MNTLTICQAAEQEATLRMGNGEDPFHMPVPKAYFIKVSEVADDIHIWDEYSSPSVGDIYELMFTSEVADRAADSHAVMFVTTGWASPDNGDDEDEHVAPSQHPQRRRVRLAICGTKDGMASAMRFADDPDNAITEEGNGYGRLADALSAMLDTSALL